MINNCNLIISINSRPPTWVWWILAYLLFVGISATKKNVIYLPKLFIMPFVIIGLTYKTLFSSNNIFYCLPILIVGFVLGILIAQKIPIKILKDKKSVEIPGNYSTLITLISIFCIKFLFGYLQATNLILAKKYAFIEYSIYALFAGNRLGTLILYLYKFYKHK